MAAQFAQGQLDGVAVVEIGVRLTGVEVQLELPRLIQCVRADAAVLVVRGGIRARIAVLQQLQIQVAVFRTFRRLIPHPDQHPAASGVKLPAVRIRFQDDGHCRRELLLGEMRRGNAVFLNLAGGFGGVQRQKARFQHTVRADAFRHIEMHRVAVHMRPDGRTGFGGCGGHAQLQLRHIVHKVVIGGFRRRA